MSNSLYNNNRNIYNNINQINKKNASSSPIHSSQLNSAGKMASTPINYHYLQKEREKQKEKQGTNFQKNEIFNHKNNSLITNSFISNYKPNYDNKINTYRKGENYRHDNYSNNIINNNDNINNSNYYKNNYLRKNYENNNFLNRNSQENKEIKLQSNLIPQNEVENINTKKAKDMMDEFDKKLYDTISDFRIKNNNNEKAKDFQNEKQIQMESQSNYNTNIKRRNYSYDKFSPYNSNSNNLNNNYSQKSQSLSFRNSDNFYNSFGNNNINIRQVNKNEDYYKDFLSNNNYAPKENYRNQKNSVDKVMLSRYQIPNLYKNIQNQSNKIHNLKKYSSYSLAGTDALKHPKTNQDSYLTKEDSNNFIFGVFDGHGFEGHLVSQAIKTYLNNNLTSSSFSSNENIISTFKNLSSSINASTKFNSLESGSTVILTFISNNIIICANCGDSRAILIVENENKVVPLSRDHKPDLPDEKKRIIESGGRVDQIYGMGPFRVWFKDADYPGLAMSRSIGDGYAHKVGVIDIPEIFELKIDEIKPKAIILASDGVFEFMKNEEIKNIVGKYYYNMDAQGCSKEIVENSRNIWENSGFAIDDITCVVGFF